MSNCSTSFLSELSLPPDRGTGWEVAADRSWDVVLQLLERSTTGWSAGYSSYHLAVAVRDLSTDPRLPEQLREILRAHDVDRALRSGTGPSEECPNAGTVPSARPLPSEEHQHARLARELREMTGMSARELGACLGASREQYSRWTSGKPISDHRGGQLAYLHTMMRDLVRRVGANQARIWLRTPVPSAPDNELITPAEMSKRRLVGQIMRRVALLPSPAEGNEPSLLLLDEEDDPAGGSDPWDSAPWTPYRGSVSKRDESGTVPGNCS
jgi:hypothetical protein